MPKSYPQCDHIWHWPSKRADYRYCSVCGLEQDIRVSVKYEDIGINPELIVRPVEHVRTELMQQTDPYSGFNTALDMHIRNKTHWEEVVKEQGITPVG